MHGKGRSHCQSSAASSASMILYDLCVLRRVETAGRSYPACDVATAATHTPALSALGSGDAVMRPAITRCRSA
jgi:hypothetical protein